MARKKKRGNTISVDFSDTGSGNILHPEGRYSLKVQEATHNEEKNSVVVKAEFTSAPSKKLVGKTTSIWLSLEDNRLWVLRNFLEAAGMEVPEEPADIDLDELVDAEFSAENEHYKGENGERNSWKNFGSGDGESSSDDEDEDAELVDDDEDEDDEPKSKKKGKKDKKKSKKAKDEDDEDEEEESDDEDEDEEEAPRKSRKKKGKKAKDEDEEDEDDSDEDEDEDEKPKKGKRSKKVSEADIDEMKEKQLQKLIDTHELDVDLDDFSNIKKQRMAVKDALEENDLLDSD